MLLVFDLDGTLIDSIRDLTEASNELSAAYGGPRHDQAAVTRMVGEGARVLVDRVLAPVGGLSAHPDAFDRYVHIYDRHLVTHTGPYPGLADTLSVLGQSHVLAVLTNKPRASTERLLSFTGLDRFFRDVVCGDGPFPRKPDPAGLGWLMEQNASSPRRTMLIGDSDVDLETARAAGVRLCLARYGFGFARVTPASIGPDDIVIDQPADLLDHLSSP